MAKEVVALRGGLNTSTDRSAIKPGQMTRCMNFEVMPSGVIRRALGYRRWSGGCYYGPPSFFIWGPYNAGLQQGSAPVGEWGLPGGFYLTNETGTWVDYGRLALYTGRARLTYQFDWFGKTDNYLPDNPLGLTSGSVAVAMQGREPIRPERLSTPTFSVSGQIINQTFGTYETWPSDALAVNVHEIIDRAWPAYWSQTRGQGLETSATPDPDGVQSIPGYHPYGGIAGLTYWRDRLYVVADILSFSFSNGSVAPSVGDVVALDYYNASEATREQTGWKWYVERVITTGGDWAEGSAAGVILLIGGVPGDPTNAYPPVDSTPDWSATDGRLLDDGSDAFLRLVPGAPYLQNVTTSATDVMRLVGYADPIEEGAALWRSTDLYDAPYANGWERVDLGYEVDFTAGDNAFLVVNRISSDAYLDDDTGDGSPAVEDTGWVFPNALTLGSVPTTPSALQADDGIHVSLISGGTSPFVSQPLLAQPLTVSDFGLNVPEYSVITGIEVEINAFDQQGIISAYGPVFSRVSLKVDNETYGNKAPSGIIPTASGTTYTLGGQTDLWGATISPEVVNDPRFGILIEVGNGSVNVDYVKVRVHYKPYVSTIHFRNPNDAAKTVSSMTAYSVCRFLPVAAVGSPITVAGATPAGYNGTHAVIPKPSFVKDDLLNQFVYFIVSGMPPLTNPVTGTVTVNGNTINANLMSRVGVQVTATITDHGYLTGQYVTISGAVQAQYNGTFPVVRESANLFTYYPSSTPAANPTGTITATRNVVCSASAVWYYKDKGDWQTNDARGILTIYDATIPSAIGAGQQIRSGIANDGALYALTGSVARRVYMPSSKDLTRNKSRYEWLVANFTRSVVFEQLFGVSGAGLAFSFDGKYFIRIRTGLSKALDRPRHLAEHNFQLALGYSFGDVAFSDLGFPESFSATFEGASPASNTIGFVGGSTTVSVSDPVHGMLRLPEQSLAVFCENSIRRITGAGGVFTEQVVRAGHGITEYTARNVNGMVVFTDSLGVMLLRPTDLFGQLLPQYVSSSIAELLSEAEMSSLAGPHPRILFAHAFNNKNQYRIFFNDGSYVAMTLVGAEMEPQFWVGQYDFVPFCVGIGVHSDRRQVQFAGHVYTANHLLPFAGPGGQPSVAGPYGMQVRPAWPFQLDVTSTWDTNAMPALATFFLGDMAEKGGLHAIKRFSNVSMDVRAYGYASMAAVFSTRFGEKVAVRVKSGDFMAITDRRPVSVGAKQGGDYLNVQQYRTTVGANCAGEWLLMTVESDGSRDYDAGAADAGIRWLRPFELGVAAVNFDLNRDANATETTGL